MSKKLYIGNLDYGVTKDDLLDLFSKAGKVIDAVVISDKYSGRSKGFGFVEYEKDEEATKALKCTTRKNIKEGIWLLMKPGLQNLETIDN